MTSLSTAVSAIRGLRMRSTATVRTMGALLMAFAMGGPPGAQGQSVRIGLEPMYLSPYGHDQHVLTMHELDFASNRDSKTAVTLDTRAGIAYRGELRYSRGRWTWGVAAFWFDTSQETPTITLAAGASTDEVSFEVADRGYTSSNPGEVLFYRVLEDTDVAIWTVDLYGERTLAESAGHRLALQLGVRFGDFDNDYRAVVGVESSIGSRFDASSNYGRMTGPLVGLVGTLQVGRTTAGGYVGQSVIMGEPAFAGTTRQFTGPFDSPAYFAVETFQASEKIAIPITELRIRGTYALMGQVALGVGVTASSWWDVGVPPGIAPLGGGDQILHENTLVFFGAMLVLEIEL